MLKSRRSLWIFTVLLCAIINVQGCSGSGVKNSDSGNAEEVFDGEKIRAPWAETSRRPILDRTGMVLALSEKSLSVYVCSGISGQWDEVSRILGLDPEEVTKRMSQVNGMVCLSRDVTPAQAKALQGLGLEKVRIFEGHRRSYPYGRLGSPVLGLVDSQGMGVTGVEFTYNSLLSCSLPGFELDRPEVKGLSLCIEKDLQLAVEKELARQMHRLRAKRGCLVFMDISKGDILALASSPCWDPVKYWEYDASYQKNMAVTDLWDPVLLFPVLSRILNAPTGQLEASGEKADDKALAAVSTTRQDLDWNWLEVTDTLALWTPWGEEETGLEEDPQRLLSKLYALGLGRPTGVDLPDEQIGGLPTNLPEVWTEIQGLRASPLQILRAFAALVGAGGLVTPHVAMEPFWKGGHSGPEEASALGWLGQDQILSLRKDLSYKRRPYLISVRKRRDGSGGSQVVLLGFWPCKDPKVVYVLALDQAVRSPRKARGTFMGSLRLAAKAKGLVSTSFAREGVDKKRIKKRAGRMPNLKGLSMRQAYTILSDMGLQVQINGSGRVIDQRPAPGTPIKTFRTGTIICKGLEG